MDAKSFFDAPTDGCEFIFHLAAPINFESTDQEVQLACFSGLIEERIVYLQN